MNPVWIQFPQIPWGSIGWRMGFGEVYWYDWHDWFKTLSASDLQSYKAQWPEPEAWTGFYVWTEHGVTPPHILEQREKTKAAAKVPSPDESRITDVYRCRWLVQSYLKFSGRYDDSDNLLFVAPNGDGLIGSVAGGEMAHRRRMTKSEIRIPKE
jgi:hypothetical protein